MQEFCSLSVTSAKRLTLVLVIIFLSILLLACETTGPATEEKAKFADDKKGVVLLYSEREEAGTPLFLCLTIVFPMISCYLIEKNKQFTALPKLIKRSLLSSQKK